MKKRSTYILIAILLSIGLFMGAYEFLDNKLENYLATYETASIDKIIDGDTVESNGTSIRLLGINTPEKGEKYSSEATEYLKSLALNKTVRLEFGKDRKDLYGRTLAYLYLEGDNINKKIIEQGYANYYFPAGKDIHYNDFADAWNNCLNEEKNLCEISDNKCGSCINLKEFDYNNEVVVLENSCGFDCELTDWEIKDEGRKKFIFPKFTLGNNKQVTILIGEEENTGDTLYWNRNSYVWTSTGDTLFLRDEEGQLVLWESY